jgi:hypothetical protein
VIKIICHSNAAERMRSNIKLALGRIMMESSHNRSLSDGSAAVEQRTLWKNRGVRGGYESSESEHELQRALKLALFTAIMNRSPFV